MSHKYFRKNFNPPFGYEIQNDPSVVPASGETVPVNTFSYNDASGNAVTTDFKFGTDTNSLYIEKSLIITTCF